MTALRRTVAATVFTTVLACQPSAVGTHYAGEPLFSISGELVLRGAAAPRAPIRLAVAWYPSQSATSAPKALVTQEVQYQGSFPLKYTFSFFGVPPAAALGDYGWEGATARAAFGVLLAYEDLNGNGQLDSIAAGGSPVDRVLGTSLGDTYNAQDVETPVYVAYVDGPAPAAWKGYGPGYNLESQGVVVPPSTPVQVPLDQTNELNFFVCDEFISGDSYGFELPCHITPTGGVRVIGNVYKSGHIGAASLLVSDGTSPLPEAVVEVNGARVPFVDGLYFASGIPVLAPGRNVVRVTANGQPPLVFEMDAPGEFTMSAPVDGLKLYQGDRVEASWAHAPGASFYQVGGSQLSPPYTNTPNARVTDRGEAAFTATLDGFDTDDGYRVQVVAFAPRYVARGRGGSLVNVSTFQQAGVDVLPVGAVGLRLEGTVTYYDGQGLQTGAAWVSAYDGLTALRSATVTVNGAPLAWRTQYELYALDTAPVLPGRAARLTVSTAGRAPVSVDVAVPGDFAVSGVPANHLATEPMPLRWDASVAASGYQAWVTDARGTSLFAVGLVETHVVIPPLHVTGTVYVNIAATEVNPGERRLQGYVQKLFAVELR